MAAKENGTDNGNVRRADEHISKAYADSHVHQSGSMAVSIHRPLPIINRANSRQTGIEHRHASLEQPQQEGVQRPTHDLRLRASQPQPVFW